MVAGVEAQAQYALDRPWASTVAAVIGMVAKVAGVVVLTHTDGLTGAAVGFAAGTLVQFAIQSVDVARHLHGPARRWLPLRQVVGILVAYAAGFGVALGADRALAEPWGLLAGLAAGSVAFLVAYAVVGGVMPRDRERIEQARRRLAKPAGERAAASG